MSESPCEFVGVSGEQCSRLKELLSRNPCPTPRRKRAPSIYNLYASACIKAKGGIKKFGEGGPIMRQCAAEYREDKAKGKFRYEIPQASSNPGSSYQGYTKGNEAPLWKGRDLQKEWHNLFMNVSGARKKK